jgi:integrase
MRFLLWLPLHSASKLLFAGIRLHRAQQRKECPPGKTNQLQITFNSSAVFNSLTVRINTCEAAGLDRKHWSTARPIRTIFNEAFASVGLPYFNPHIFRKTLALLADNAVERLRSTRLGHNISAMNTS